MRIKLLHCDILSVASVLIGCLVLFFVSYLHVQWSTLRLQYTVSLTREQSFSTYATFSEKPTFVCSSGVMKCWFFGKFCVHTKQMVLTAHYWFDPWFTGSLVTTVGPKDRSSASLAVSLYLTVPCSVTALLIH